MVLAAPFWSWALVILIWFVASVFFGVSHLNFGLAPSVRVNFLPQGELHQIFLTWQH